MMTNEQILAMQTGDRYIINCVDRKILCIVLAERGHHFLIMITESMWSNFESTVLYMPKKVLVNDKSRMEYIETTSTYDRRWICTI